MNILFHVQPMAHAPCLIRIVLRFLLALPAVALHRAKITPWATLLIMCFLVPNAFAESKPTPPAKLPVQIQVNQSDDQPIRISVVPFKQFGVGRVNIDMAHMIRKHFVFSGLLDPVPVKDMLSLPYQLNQVHYQDWQKNKSEYILIGSIHHQAKSHTIQVALIDVLQKRQVFTYNSTVNQKTATAIVNLIANRVFKHITGINGIFESRFSFVQEETVRIPGGAKKRYSLKVVNLNGENARTIFHSFKPIWSPAWSDKGTLAYVTFLRNTPAVAVQDLVRNKRYYVTLPKSITSAPDWGNNERQLLITLNRNGNADLALFDTKKRTMKRLTRHARIDTEGSWSPDMKRIIFTSDRHGPPQIMEYNVASRRVTRITKDRAYNANPRYIDENTIVFVRRDTKRKFNLFTMNLDTGFMDKITDEKGDVESVSVSPNGHYAVYTVTTEKTSRLKIIHIKSKRNFAFFEGKSGNYLRSAAWSRGQ